MNKEHTQKELDMLETLINSENDSSGEIALEADVDPSVVKHYMREFEKLEYGDYVIIDGMYHFQFTPFWREYFIGVFRG